MILDDFSVATVTATPSLSVGSDASHCGYCSSMENLTLAESYKYDAEDSSEGSRVTMTFDKAAGDGLEQSLMFDAVVGSDNNVKLDNVFLYETNTATGGDESPIYGASKHVYFGKLAATAQEQQPSSESASDYVTLSASGNGGKCNLSIKLTRQ